MATPFDVNYRTTPSPVSQTRGNFENILGGFTGAIQGQETVPQLTQRYQDQYGAPQLRDQYNQGQEALSFLGSTIRAIPESIQNASQNSLVTQGQANRMAQAQAQPLLEQYNMLGENVSRIGDQLGQAETLASQMVSAEQIQQQKELAPWLQAFNNEEILGAMEMTGWTFQNQAELNRLIHNSQIGMTLSENEKNRMHDLAMQENQFNAQMNQIREQGNQARQTKKALPDLASLWNSMMG